MFTSDLLRDEERGGKDGKAGRSWPLEPEPPWPTSDMLQHMPTIVWYLRPAEGRGGKGWEARRVMASRARASLANL